MANLRGGSEYGEKWHQAGMLANKQNCFDDFNSCAEWLFKENYTNPNKLIAMGGSNGGLLMGAVATQRPDLYKAIVCAVPLLDMIRYHKFLIARYWIPEYGSSENDEDFRWRFHRYPKASRCSDICSSSSWL
jgi:prolyl oligopeptidase